MRTKALIGLYIIGLYRIVLDLVYSHIVYATRYNIKDYKGKRTVQEGDWTNPPVQSISLCVPIPCGLYRTILPLRGEEDCLVQPPPLPGLKGKRYFDRHKLYRYRRSAGFQ